MARVKPTTMDALRHVYGVGERKAADLGERFLAEIRASSS
jgi:superfamily II DNA helicase RecQ